MNNSQLTPPLELVHQWTSFACEEEDGESWNSIATQAAQWGADQELEATLSLMETLNIRGVDYIRNARRPKPLTLAEQVTAKLDDAVMRGDCITTTDAMPLLRAAIKRLAELETPHD
jgi:hypothetical protein